MIRRYSGSLRIYISLGARGVQYFPCRTSYQAATYTVRVARDGKRLGTVTVNRAPAERRCEENPALLDEVAHAALSFLDHEGIDLSGADHTDTGWSIMRAKAPSIAGAAENAQRWLNQYRVRA